MSVSPMDLQVIFMQEGRAAKEVDRAKNFAGEMRSYRAKQSRYLRNQESVGSINTAESKTIDEEGSQGSPDYFAHRREQEPELREDEEEEAESPEPELGKMMDLRI